MKLKLIVLFLFLFPTLYGQNIVIDITEKSQESIENPASDYRVIEPKADTLNLSKQKIFSLVIEYSGEINSLHIIDYPLETYADLNNLKRLETDEEYDSLTNEEWTKFNVIIPKHKVLKEGFLSRKIVKELEITSDRITHTEIYADSKLIKTIYYRSE